MQKRKIGGNRCIHIILGDCLLCVHSSVKCLFSCFPPSLSLWRMFYAVKGENELACLLDGSNGVNFPSPVFVSFLPSLFFYPGPVFFFYVIHTTRLSCQTWVSALSFTLFFFFTYLSIFFLPSDFCTFSKKQKIRVFLCGFKCDIEWTVSHSLEVWASFYFLPRRTEWRAGLLYLGSVLTSLPHCLSRVTSSFLPCCPDQPFHNVRAWKPAFRRFCTTINGFWSYSTIVKYSVRLLSAATTACCVANWL